MTISLCMIVKNEEAVLARCLESARGLVDEIAIVDTGSEDGTVAIAKNYTENVTFEAWRDDFAHARNAAFSRAHGDYLLWLDADDVIPAASREIFPKIKKILEEENPDTVMCPYETGDVIFRRERIVRNCEQAKWQGHVHECIPPFGKIVNADFAVIHMGAHKERGARNLDIYRKWAQEGTLGGRDLFYYGRELYYHKLYVEAEAILEKMLDGAGWAVNKIEACKILAACYWESGEREKALPALFRSFLYGEPRAAVLCEIGAIFKEQGMRREAVYWYESALACRDHTADGDFELPACRSIIPTLELVALYHALNEPAKSLEYHKKSEAIAPDHPSVLYNQKFFGE